MSVTAQTGNAPVAMDDSESVASMRRVTLSPLDSSMLKVFIQYLTMLFKVVLAASIIFWGYNFRLYRTISYWN